jgi:hypothetical protein
MRPTRRVLRTPLGLTAAGLLIAASSAVLAVAAARTSRPDGGDA